MSTNGPTSGEPEYLSSDDPAAPRESKPRSGKKPALLVGGAVVLAGLVGGGLWLWSAYSSTGDQPSQALPADALGYVAVDLDPSGKQKIEAIRTLRKFPAFRDAVDIEDEDDVRRRIVEEALADSECDVDYADDIEPWLGQRFGLAALPGDEQPDPVFVLQVTDADAADKGLATLRECGDGDSGAWEIRGDWAVVAETAEIAGGAADAAEESSLADDEDFQKWTGAAGDEGILTAYASPSAGETLGQLFAGDGMTTPDAFGSDELAPEVVPDTVVPPQLEGALEEFGGAAMTMRFADGAVELEAATASTNELDYASSEGGGVVTTLPADTAVALGAGFSEGWGEAALDAVREQLGPDADDAIGFAESQLGLELPADLETVFGESMALSLGADFDVNSFAESPDGSTIPVGAKIQGDAEGIEGVLDKLQAAAGPAGEAILGTDSEGDLVAVGPNEDYRDELLGDGGLGDSDAYQNVVREGDKATAVLFVNFDAEDWLAGLVRDQGDAETAENLEPLEAVGISAWQEDDDNHVLLRVTTEE